MEQREIVRIRAGSHLHGTNREESDIDLVAVYIPSGKDILLQKVKLQARGTGHEEPKKPGQEDLDVFSLHRFLGLVCGGHMRSIELLFAPESAYLNPPEAEWRAILQHRDRLIGGSFKATVGYLAAHVKNQRTAETPQERKRKYHVLRILGQLLELLETRKITFPRPDYRFLKAVKVGKIPLTSVDGIIEEGFCRVRGLLGEAPNDKNSNSELVDNLVERFHRSAVSCVGK